jgi:hypothetical protein
VPELVLVLPPVLVDELGFPELEFHPEVELWQPLGPQPGLPPAMAGAEIAIAEMATAARTVLRSMKASSLYPMVDEFKRKHRASHGFQGDAVVNG